MDAQKCKKCGECCRLNGLIPPVLEMNGGDTGPAWLLVLVRRLREEFADIAETMPCIFLVDNHCAIYDDRPSVCREFDCTLKETNGQA